MTSIQYIQDGDLLQSHAEALINTVNCVGVMGRGVALQFKNAFPSNFVQYKKACKEGVVVPGRMLVHETGLLTSPKYIINFPTKRHWKGKSRIEDIESGLDSLRQEIESLGIRSIAIPPLGSGLGGLDWREVKPLIEHKLRGLSVQIELYEPINRTITTKSAAVPSMNVMRAITIELLDEYLQGLMDPFVSLLEVQKLLYFVQNENPNLLRLKYDKGSYGPYAPDLRHVLKAIEGYYIHGYGDGGDAPQKPLELIPGAVEDARRYLKDNLEALRVIERVTSLVRGFETSYGLELLATVHWVMKEEGAESPEMAVKTVHEWNARKKRFGEYQIMQARNWILTHGALA